MKWTAMAAVATALMSNGADVSEGAELGKIQVLEIVDFVCVARRTEICAFETAFTKFHTTAIVQKRNPCPNPSGVEIERKYHTPGHNQHQGQSNLYCPDGKPGRRINGWDGNGYPENRFMVQQGKAVALGAAHREFLGLLNESIQTCSAQFLFGPVPHLEAPECVRKIATAEEMQVLNDQLRTLTEKILDAEGPKPAPVPAKVD